MTHWGRTHTHHPPTYVTRVPRPPTHTGSVLTSRTHSHLLDDQLGSTPSDTSQTNFYLPTPDPTPEDSGTHLTSQSERVVSVGIETGTRGRIRSL